MKTLSAFVSDGVRQLPFQHAAFGLTLIAYKTAADVASKLVTLVVTVAAARVLAPADFGVMALAMTTGWLLGVASDAGLPMFGATRVAQAHAAGVGSYPLARTILRWRAQLALAAAAGGAVMGALLVPRSALVAFTLIVLHQVFGAVLETVAHIYRGLGRTDIESTVSLAHRGAVAFGAIVVLAVAPSLLALSVALVVPPLLACLVAAGAVRRIAAPGPPFPLTAPGFVRSVAPLGLGVLLSALYFRIDVYFLERLHGIETVGAYNAVFRLVDALRLFPGAALAVAYPWLCAATTHATLRKLCAVVLAASGIIAITLYATAHQLLDLVYGPALAGAGPALRVLSFSIPLLFVNYALTHQLIAWDRQRAYLSITVAALATNVAGNLLLIPTGGMTGAAYSTLVTEVVVCAGCLAALRHP